MRFPLLYASTSSRAQLLFPLTGRITGDRPGVAALGAGGLAEWMTLWAHVYGTTASVPQWLSAGLSVLLCERLLQLMCEQRTYVFNRGVEFM